MVRGIHFSFKPFDFGGEKMDRAIRGKALTFISVLIFVCMIWMPLRADKSYGAEKQVKVKITSIQSLKGQGGRMAQHFADLASKQFGDRVKVTVYPSGQLYKMVEEINALTRGDTDIAITVGPSLEGIHPVTKVFKIPFLFPNETAAYRVVDGKIGDMIFADLEKKNILVKGMVWSGPYFVANSKRPLLKMEDFKGLKLISQGITQSITMDALGAQSVNIPNVEQLAALQQGVADGVGTPSSVFTRRNFETVQKYVSNVGTMWFSYVYALTNSRFWNSIPKDMQDGFNKIFAEVVQADRIKVKEEVAEILGTIKKAGLEISEVSPEELAKWEKKVEPVYEQMLQKEEIPADLFRKVKEAAK